MTSTVIALPDMLSRAMRVAAAREAALAAALATPAPPGRTSFTSGSRWIDTRTNALVEARAVMIGMAGKPIFVTVARPGAPDGQRALRLPDELRPLYADEVAG